MYSDELYHFGIKGMKWGIRRYQNADGSLTAKGMKRYSNVDSITSKKTGEKLYVAQMHNKKSSDSSRDFEIIRDGKKVGNLFLEKQGDNLYINWINTKKSERGKGYANSIMDYTVGYAKKNGYKTMTLEVPGSSNDARHIYEKHGFKVDKSRKGTSNDVWDGLTPMKRDVKQKPSIDQLIDKAKRSGNAHALYINKHARNNPSLSKKLNKTEDPRDFYREVSRELYKKDDEYKKLYDQYVKDYKELKKYS